MASCHEASLAASASASGVPTTYPIDLYTFIVCTLLNEKDHAAACAARAVVGDRRVLRNKVRQNEPFRFSRYLHRGNIGASRRFALSRGNARWRQLRTFHTARAVAFCNV